MPVTNELLEDSDANITQIMVNWLGDAARVTDNALILAQLGTKAVTVMGTIEELKYAVIVTLGQAFAETCAIITNDDGLLWMDTLKDENKRPLLKEDNPLYCIVVPYVTKRYKAAIKERLDIEAVKAQRCTDL